MSLKNLSHRLFLNLSMVYIFNGKDIGKIVALIFLDKTQKRKKIKWGN